MADDLIEGPAGPEADARARALGVGALPDGGTAPALGAATVVEADRLSRWPMPPVLAFFTKRLAQALVTLLLMSALIYAATNVLPGNVAQTVLGKQATPRSVASLEHKLGLNRPLGERYVNWLAGAVRGDFGRSAVAVAEDDTAHASVAGIIGTPLRNSAILAILAMLVTVPVSVLLGVIAGTKGGSKRDYAISYPALVFGAFPEFVLGLALIAVFFSALGLLSPVALVAPGTTPLTHPATLILPVLTLVGVSVGWAARQVRAGMVEVMGRDYVTMARLSGIPERRILWRYGLRNALATSVQALAQTAQYLLGGVIVVEVLFSYPGVGNLLDQSVQSRDIPVVQAVALVIAAVYLAINIAADLIVVLLVPRLKTAMLG